MPGNYIVPGALSVVQIDHTPIDVQVVDEASRQCIGRPWLTLAVDVATRVICGFHVTLQAPSQLSVALCLTHAVLSKEGWLSDRQLTCQWTPAGLPTTLHSDNGRDLRSDGVARGCEEYGIEHVFRPPGGTHFGGHVERLIGTMMGQVHLLPGTTYSNVQERGDYPSEKAATLTLRELERWLAIEICEGYHHAEHRSLGVSPLEAWNAEMRRGTKVTMPADPRLFLLSFLPVETRTLQRTGIQIENIRYWSNVLPAVLAINETVTVRIDPRNLAKIYVKGRDGHYIDVPYADIRRPPIALWELRAARQLLKSESGERVREEALFRKILAQRTLVADAVTKTRETRRAAERQCRIMGSEAQSVGGESTINWSEDPVCYPVETWSVP